MRLYAESSAVLAWLLGETTGRVVHEALDRAQFVVASDLTLVECDRALIRAETVDALTEAQATDRRARLRTASSYWHLLHVDDDVVSRARRRFPGQPIRTLDALHLASALVVAAAVEDLAVLSLDHRIRTASSELGLRVVPA
ncbi:MAG: PIN domain-containing protein [Candidatus Rokubacteria bacterium]|nr:PIN domain-containing protein [Candidatus Rokubacteria bacterium]